jgi:hypothetical protein
VLPVDAGPTSVYTEPMDDAAPDGSTTTYISEVELPDEAVVQHSIMVVSYYDADAHTKYGFSLHGETTLAAALGLLDIVKAHLIESSYGS